MTMAPSPVRGCALDRAMIDLTRACIVTAFNKFNSGERFPRERWADDEVYRVERVLKAASSSATTSTPGWAQELTQLSLALLTNLIPVSAGAELLTRAIDCSSAFRVSTSAFEDSIISRLKAVMTANLFGVRLA
jgi:hypothetical protein